MPSADPPNNELTLTYKSSYVTLICLLIYAHPVPNPRMISMSRYLTTILSIWAPCVDRGPIAIKCSPTCPAYPIRRFGGRAASDRVSGQMRLVARQNLTLLTSEASWTILSSCLQHFADHASRFFVAGVQYSSDVVGFSWWVIFIIVGEKSEIHHKLSGSWYLDLPLHSYKGTKVRGLKVFPKVTFPP